MAEVPEYRAYCKLCDAASAWYPVMSSAEAWRELHFDDQHPAKLPAGYNSAIEVQEVELSRGVFEGHKAAESKLERALNDNND